VVLCLGGEGGRRVRAASQQQGRPYAQITNKGGAGADPARMPRGDDSLKHLRRKRKGEKKPYKPSWGKEDSERCAGTLR